MLKGVLIVLVAIAVVAHGKIYFHETFDTKDKWVSSVYKDDYGRFELSSGEFYGDKKANQGLKTAENAHFYAASRKLDEPVNNDGKDFVVSLSVKHEQGLDCGGGYIKLLPEMDPKRFHGESEYYMMFGPDQCGYTRKVHIIFNYKGENLLWKKEPRYPDDKLTHVYTVVVKSDNTYEFFIDMEKKESGKLEEDWKFLKPREIDDPTDKKPDDWVDVADMDDPDDKKPADWDNEPATVADPDAKQPEDWNDEEDGEWQHPTIPNPKYKGTWKPKKIPNPKYKGQWKPRQIANPDFKEDAKMYAMSKPIQHVGIDVWQVKAGSIFDDIIIGDNLEEVNALVEKTWKATKDAEKKAFDEKEAAAKKEEEKKKEEERRRTRRRTRRRMRRRKKSCEPEISSSY